MCRRAASVYLRKHDACLRRLVSTIPATSGYASREAVAQNNLRPTTAALAVPFRLSAFREPSMRLDAEPAESLPNQIYELRTHRITESLDDHESIAAQFSFPLESPSNS